MKKLAVVLITVLCFAAAAFAAALDGAWDVTYRIPDDTVHLKTTYKTKGSALFIVGDEGDMEVGTITGDAFSYKVPNYYSDRAGYRADLIIKGKVTGNRITGTWEWDTYNGTFEGARAK